MKFGQKIMIPKDIFAKSLDRTTPE